MTIATLTSKGIGCNPIVFFKNRCNLKVFYGVQVATFRVSTHGSLFHWLDFLEHSDGFSRPDNKKSICFAVRGCCSLPEKHENK